MLLAEVLRLHDAFEHEQTFGNVLGDGYLYHSNHLYRRVRKLTLALGFRFGEAREYPYAQLPLACLEPIWQHRLVPLVPNVAALRHIELRAPGRMRFWEVAEQGLKRTPLFHESVHCLARSVVRHGSRPLPRSPQRRVLELMFEESCANAAEALCFALAVTDTQRLFAQMHLYDTPYGCGLALERLGFRAAFELQTIACLHSNFLRDSMSSAEVWRAARAALPCALLAQLGREEVERFFRRAFTLSQDFRVKTASFSLKLAGFAGTVDSLLNFDFASQLVAGRRLRRNLSVIGSLLEDDTPSTVTDPSVRSASLPEARFSQPPH